MLYCTAQQIKILSSEFSGGGGMAMWCVGFDSQNLRQSSYAYNYCASFKFHIASTLSGMRNDNFLYAHRNFNQKLFFVHLLTDLFSKDISPFIGNSNNSRIIANLENANIPLISWTTILFF